jgi:hypothetical protein
LKSPSRKNSEVAVHFCAVIVHRIDPKTGKWEALDGGQWAKLNIFQEKVGFGAPLYRIVAHAESAPSVSIDTLLTAETKWNQTKEDWVELVHKATQYGLAFATSDVATNTTRKIESAIVIMKVAAAASSSKRMSFKGYKQGTGKMSKSALPANLPPPPLPPSQEPPAPVSHVAPPGPGHAQISSASPGQRTSTVRVASQRRPSGLIAVKDLPSPVPESPSSSPSSSPGSSDALGKTQARKRSLAAFHEVESAVLSATSFDNEEDSPAVSYEEAVTSEIQKISEQLKTDPNRMTLDSNDFSLERTFSDPPIPARTLSVFDEAKASQKALIGPDGKSRLSSEHAIDEDDHSGISRPTNVTNAVHITYNELNARYEGLPDGSEWKVMNKQFGIPLGAVPKRTVEQYEERIPAVLEMMKNYLLQNDGANVVGIFRLAPDRDDCLWVKQQINEGEFNGCADVNIIANLIKVFFRELPVSLYDCIAERDIVHMSEMKAGKDVLIEMEAKCMKNLSLVWWLMDLMSTICMNEKVNRMTVKNISICMSPNLYSINSENPMVALTMSQKVADFTSIVLASRLEVTHGFKI